MFAPGRIVHLRRSEPSNKSRATAAKASAEEAGSGRAKSGGGVEAVWVGRDALAQGGDLGLGARLLFPNAATDHFPWNIIGALGAAMGAAMEKSAAAAAEEEGSKGHPRHSPV